MAKQLRKLRSVSKPHRMESRCSRSTDRSPLEVHSLERRGRRCSTRPSFAPTEPRGPPQVSDGSQGSASLPDKAQEARDGDCHEATGLSSMTSKRREGRRLDLVCRPQG